MNSKIIYVSKKKEDLVFHVYVCVAHVYICMVHKGRFLSERRIDAKDLTDAELPPEILKEIESMELMML